MIINLKKNSNILKIIKLLMWIIISKLINKWTTERKQRIALFIESIYDKDSNGVSFHQF